VVRSLAKGEGWMKGALRHKIRRIFQWENESIY
jgi:hypothetical protein